jgi:hypothetical protein
MWQINTRPTCASDFFFSFRYRYSGDLFAFVRRKMARQQSVSILQLTKIFINFIDRSGGRERHPREDTKKKFNKFFVGSLFCRNGRNV